MIRKIKKRKITLYIVIITILIFIIYNLITFYNIPEMSAVSYTRTKEVSYEFEGIICRNEEVVDIDIDKKGMLDPVVMENQMVKKGALIANYYDSNIDDSTRSELNYINQKIIELKSKPDEYKTKLTEQELKSEIENKINEIIEISPSRDVYSIKNKKNEIEVLINNNNEDNDIIQNTETVESLTEKKEKIENEYEGEKKEINAPVHGVYSTYLDGYEKIISVEKSLSMSVNDFENIKNKNIEPLSGDDLPEIKIVDSFSWSISVLADEKTAKNFEVGNEIGIRFGGEEKEIKATISYISLIKSGKCVITAISDNYSDFAVKNRFAKVTFVKETYNGLHVPVKAIRVKDGKTGVYVKTENTVKYKEIEILYKDEKDAIVKIDNTKSNALLLYDEIVID